MIDLKESQEEDRKRLLYELFGSQRFVDEVEGSTIQ